MSIELPGLDGSNPMGLLAALGVLAAGEHTWRLGWREASSTAFIIGPTSLDAVIERLAADRLRWMNDGPLAEIAASDIKLPQAEFRTLAQRLLGSSSASWLGVLGNEVVEDGSGKNIQPSALHFTAGQQKFFSTAREIRDWQPSDYPSTDQLRRALVGPWLRDHDVKSLGWDATVSRDYALRFRDPSVDKKLTEAGAEWLAFRGLLALPCAPVDGRLETACCGGSWKNGWFRWPLWGCALSFAGIQALLQRQDLASLSPAQRHMLGVFEVFVSQIRRSDQGGYGSFAPSRPARPSDDPGLRQRRARQAPGTTAP